MYKKELWLKAYAKLYPKQGYLTRNTYETIDEMSLQKIEEIIQDLKKTNFRFSPESLLKKSDGFLETPNFRDEMVEEVMRIILVNIYEPVFSENSHAFRPGRSCHTALLQIKRTWKDITWCITGHVRGCPENLDPGKMIKILDNKIEDRRFILLIHNALKCGITKKRTSRVPQSKTPWRGIISPLLANIYLHEFDRFMEEQIKQFEAEKGREMKYVRYADDFVIGISGSKKDALKIKEIIREFMLKNLKLELSEEKTLIVHLQKKIDFLGYQFRRWNPEKTLFSKISLEIPKQKLVQFSRKNHYGNLDTFKVTPRTALINNSEMEILYTFNAELRGIAQYYKLADNYHMLEKVFHLARGSFVKTLANKRKTTSQKIYRQLGKGSQGELTITAKKGKPYKLLSFKHMPKDRIPKPITIARRIPEYYSQNS